MNLKEIGEIRRRQRRDRSNMPAIYGCYVNDKKEIISEFKRSTGLMPENEAERYFGLMRRALSGTLGKNLIDLTFQTAQVADSPEHKLLMQLRQAGLQDENVRREFYEKAIASIELGQNYLILLGCDSYDVPFKGKDGETFSDRSDETYTYILCAICPVKQTKANLHYVPEEKEFHDGNIVNIVSAPELGFLFPAFDNRGTNIYNALYYHRSVKENYEPFVTAVFHTPVARAAAEQKTAFEALLNRTLEEECSLDVVQSVHDQLCQQIQIHKESRVPEALLINKEQVADVLEGCGVSQEHMAKFRVDFDEAFGYEAQLHPKNIIDNRKIEVSTSDVVIKVASGRSDLIQTRVLGGVKYILIRADEDVTVNGVSVHIGEEEKATV